MEPTIILACGDRSEAHYLLPVEEEIAERDGAYPCWWEYNETPTPPDAEAAIVIGDRYEALQAAMALHRARIPIYHLGAGEVSLGALDDDYRGCITLLSEFALCFDERAATQVPERMRYAVDVVGNPSVDAALTAPGLDSPPLDEPYILVACHPETATVISPSEQAAHIGAALAEIRTEYTIVATAPNSDTGADEIESAVRGNSDVYYPSLGADWYRWLKYADLLWGNSSAAYYEAPLFGTRCVDVGDRQLGRGGWQTDDEIARPGWGVGQIVGETHRLVSAGKYQPKFPHGESGAPKKIVDLILGDLK